MWGLGIGFAIVAAGTILGELANFMCVVSIGSTDLDCHRLSRPALLIELSSTTAAHEGVRSKRSSSATLCTRRLCVREAYACRLSCVLVLFRGTVCLSAPPFFKTSFDSHTFSDHCGVRNKWHGNVAFPCRSDIRSSEATGRRLLRGFRDLRWL